MDTTLAVLIDFENIAAGTEKERLGRFDINAIMSRLVDKGRVLIARSYADWGRFSRFKQSLLAANVTMYELTSHGMQDKNRADIAMVVDALELAFTKDYIDTFVIVSGDSDFTPLVLKMRELDKRVIGIGTRSSTSRLLVNACDEFIFYDSIVKAKSRSKTQRPRGKDGKKSRRQWAYDLLVDALAGLQREDPKAPLASIVKNAMRRKSPDFSESELGFNSFARFLEAARDSGYVRLDQDRKAGGYRVDSVDGSVDDGDLDEDDEASNGEDWVDTYLPKGTEKWVEALDEVNLHPLSFPARMQVLQLVEACATERQKKRRKVNIQFLREDVRKRLRKTFPDIPARLIRGVFTALMQAGLLIHKDGTAIRSTSAPFHLEADAEGMNSSLLSFYLATLEEQDADLHDVTKLAELLLGDTERRRDVETALAWLAQSQIGVGDEASLNDIDLDDLLVLEDDGGSEKAKKVEKPEAKKVEKPEAKKVEKSEPEATEASETDDGSADDADASPSSDLDDALLVEDDAASEEPKKKRPRRRKKVTRKPAVEAAEPAAEEAEEPTPRKRTRRRVRKKPADEAESDPNDLDLDALLSSD